MQARAAEGRTVQGAGPHGLRILSQFGFPECSLSRFFSFCLSNHFLLLPRILPWDFTVLSSHPPPQPFTSFRLWELGCCMILKPEPALSLPGPLGRKQEWQSTCPRRIELTQAKAPGTEVQAQRATGSPRVLCPQRELQQPHRGRILVLPLSIFGSFFPTPAPSPLSTSPERKRLRKGSPGSPPPGPLPPFSAFLANSTRFLVWHFMICDLWVLPLMSMRLAWYPGIPMFQVGHKAQRV